MNRCSSLSRILPAAVAISAAEAGLADSSLRLDYREITLENRLRVITLEDFTCPIVNVQLWYHVGSKDENPERQGFAHMFEHMMFRGTDRLGPTDHFDLIRRTGGTCNAYTSFDQTVYHETLPANQLELALWLEAERMTFLKIDQQTFDTERQVVEEERRMYVNRPYGTLYEKALSELFRVHPYRWSVIGCIPHLRAASVPELREFWTRFYVPNNAVLVIAGAVRHDEAQRMARKYFGWIPAYPDPARVTVREPQQTAARSVTLAEDNAPAPLVGIGGRTVPIGHADEIALDLLGTILGEGTSSRIYRELVAQKELATLATAMSYSLEHDGFFGAGAMLPPVGAKPDEALAAIDRQIERLRTEPVSPKELEKARNQMLRQVVMESLTNEHRARALGRTAVLEGDAARVNTRLDRVRAVTADDLLRVARQYLAPERLIKARVERNIAGAVGGALGFTKAEEAPPVTARPETDPPPPGRPGLKRPDDFPAKPPVAALPEYDPTPKYESATLPNGLKVIVVENRKGPFVSVQLGLRAGAWTETRPGTASMALGMLTKGTKRHTEAELADELETYAISLSGDGGMDNSSVSASCITDHVERTVRLLAEVVRTPTFPEDEFRKLRQQVRTSLAVSTNEPSYIADREFRRRVYGEHPYARTTTGELEDVDALTVADVRQWWRQFARPSTAVLLFAGDIDMDRARALAEAGFGDWAAETAAPEAAMPAVPPSAPTRIWLVDRPGVQCQIRVGRYVDLTRQDPDYFTGIVVSGYFGTSFSARLNETIRVKKGLTYGARGSYSAQRVADEFKASTFTKVARTVESVRTILDEIDRLRTEPPTADELTTTKAFTLGSFPRQRETPDSVAGDLWLIESHDLPKDYLQRLCRTVAATTGDDCMRLIRKTIDPAKMAIVVVGPAKELRDELEKIAPVTVVAASPPTSAQAATKSEEAGTR